MVEKFKAFIQDLDDREFYRYLAVFLAALVLIMGGIVFFNFGRLMITFLQMDTTDNFDGVVAMVEDNQIFSQDQTEVW